MEPPTPRAAPAPEAPRLARGVLLGVGAIWLAVAGAGLTDPSGMAEAVGIALPTPGALQEWRANYGGMAAVLAGLHAWAGWRGAHLRPALFCAAALMAGLLGGRVLSLLLDGPPGAFGLGLAATEVVGIGFCVAALRGTPGGPVSAGPGSSRSRP